MSAYGSIGAPKPIAPLEATVYPVKTGSISLHPISAAEAPEDLVSYLHGVFNQELEGGFGFVLSFDQSVWNTDRSQAPGKGPQRSPVHRTRTRSNADLQRGGRTPKKGLWTGTALPPTGSSRPRRR